MTTQQQIATSKKVALTFTLPAINFGALASKAASFLSNIYRPLSAGTIQAAEKVTTRAKRFKMPSFNLKDKFNKRNMKFILPVVLGLIVIAAIVSFVRSLPDAQSRPVDSTQSVSSTNPLATIQLDKKFDFPLKDANGKNVGSFEYVIQSAQLQKQIIIQGQRATAIPGRIFLILNLKLTNSQKQAIQLNTRDYLRLVVASNQSEQLAPDIHNDPVEVQAISTKYTRVGIAIDEKDAKKKVELKVGEIDGTKQNIDLNFKY